MFTIDQIQEAYKKVKSGVDFPRFVKDLEAIGVIYYDNFVAEGLAKYYGENNFVVDGGAKYPSITVNNESSAQKLKHAIAIHQQGQTDYHTFCQQAADAGVEKWTTHIIGMTVTYLDREGNKLIIEPISEPRRK